MAVKVLNIYLFCAGEYTPLVVDDPSCFASVMELKTQTDKQAIQKKIDRIAQ